MARIWNSKLGKGGESKELDLALANGLASLRLVGLKRGNGKDMEFRDRKNWII